MSADAPMGLASFLVPTPLPKVRPIGLVAASPTDVGLPQPEGKPERKDPPDGRVAQDSYQRRERIESEWVARLRIEVARGEPPSPAMASRRGLRGDLMQSAGTGTFVSSVEIRQLRERLESRLAIGPATGSVRRIDERA